MVRYFECLQEFLLWSLLGSSDKIFLWGGEEGQTFEEWGERLEKRVGRGRDTGEYVKPSLEESEWVEILLE